MPVPADLALHLIAAIALGLGAAAFLGQAVGGALGSLSASRRG